MENEFGYNLPVNWRAIPKEVQYVTINWKDINKLSIEINGHKSTPYPCWEKQNLVWKSDEVLSKRFTHTVQRDDTAKVIELITNERSVHFGKCIWKRPEN
jgi:hypothetical protein